MKKSFSRSIWAVLAALSSTQCFSQADEALYNFGGKAGQLPIGGVAYTEDGSVLGTTSVGGKRNCGSIFILTPEGKLRATHAFNPQIGCHPNSNLMKASDGTYYGTTLQGGRWQAGTIYNVDAQGRLLNIWPLGRKPSSPQSPLGSLVQASDGRIYGVSARGGQRGQGTVYWLYGGYKLTKIYSFQSRLNKCYTPTSGLTAASNGELYGVTRDSRSGYGCIYSISPTGVFSIRHVFSGADNQFPVNDLVFANNKIYGTTSSTSGDQYTGSIFEMGLYGGLATIRSTNEAVEGRDATIVSVPDQQGVFYATTSVGGANGSGTLFRVNGDGTIKLIRTFPATPGDGRTPTGNVVQVQANKIVGVTREGGLSSCDGKGCGVLYEANVPE